MNARSRQKNFILAHYFLASRLDFYTLFLLEGFRDFALPGEEGLVALAAGLAGALERFVVAAKLSSYLKEFG